MSAADYIRKQIVQNGPIDIGTFMTHALAHPKHGYYVTRDPLGAKGDFTTAPEISQMFGEMIGAWAADVWTQMGKPPAFDLLECGPGRGTLMADVMRATKNVAGFHDAARIQFVEISAALKLKQKQALENFAPYWHDSLTAYEAEGGDVPVIIIANEFLDALPIRQLQMTDHGWAERVVANAPGIGLVYGQRPAGAELTAFVPAHIKARPGDVFEVSPARLACARQMGELLKMRGGAALLIDYGHERAGTGDTFQAVTAHGFANPLIAPGQADLTSHVDFAALAAGVSDLVQVHGPVMQGAFLKSLGIEQRAQALSAKADAAQKQNIQSALQRLCDAGQMGMLFKVLGLSHGEDLKPAGF